jgi:hypothetical protein
MNHPHSNVSAEETGRATARVERLATAVAWTQGVYFLLTGLWPIVHIESFQAVTGEKTDHLVTGHEGDHWLVNTVGALVAAIGLSLIVAAYRQRVAPEVMLVGLLTAAALTAIDIVYVARSTIAGVYLADAALEIAIIVAWSICLVSTDSNTN